MPLCAQVIPTHMQNVFVILAAALLCNLKVLIVYANEAYFDNPMFRVIHGILSAHPVITLNLLDCQTCFDG
jgi:hypothetical protein